MAKKTKSTKKRIEKLADATPEAEATNEATAAVAPEPAPAPKKKSGRKAATLESTCADLPLSDNATLDDVAVGYLAHMKEAGRSSGTIASYGMELKTAMWELGAQTLVAEITAERVREYFDSSRVTKLKSGKPKAKPSIDKTRRVLRLALVWAQEAGLIERAPLPEAVATP